MGKTYIDTVKYLVYANAEISGLVEKPDVVGAIFGQTEGLLGDELDLRELQKNGRIGRIEVDLSPRGGKSIGKIKLPSSLDMVETSILAAALETVDRVGPCDAKIAIEKIEDTRSVKRKDLIERAKALFKNMVLTEIPESKEISEQVRSEVKASEVSSYGPDKLPAGPNIEKSESVILVEGRADVINLLKNDITDVVGVGGANVAPSVAKLCREKEVTVFLDGDRGGDIILNELARIADIDFVARAPTGKEVEELTRKELIKCLRSKVPYEQGSSGPGEEERRLGRYRPQFNNNRSGSNYGGRRESPRYEQSDWQPQAPAPQAAPAYAQAPNLEGGYVGRQPRSYGHNAPAPPRETLNEPSFTPARNTEASFAPTRNPTPEASFAPAERKEEFTAPPVVNVPAGPVPEPAGASEAAPSGPSLSDVPPALLQSLTELENTLQARFYDADLKLVKEIPVRDMIKNLDAEASVYAVVFDGIITQRLADLAQGKGAQALVGIKLGNVFRKPASVLLHTKQ